MLFNSYAFIAVFFPITLAAFAVAHVHSRQLAIVVLLAASLAFYGYWDPRYLALLLASITVNYLVSLAIARSKTRKTILLAVGLSFNLLVLAWFKYAFFFYSNFFWYFAKLDLVARLVLPLGISFFTFEQIAYLVDVRRGKVKPDDPITYALFVTFFPHLIAGPIILYQDMARQFQLGSRFNRLYLIKFQSGLLLFAIGLFKKVVLADGFAVFVSPVFTRAVHSDPSIGPLEAWIGALAYSLQLYFDFSGYSDMAVGLARMLGFRLPFNFNSPYKATDIIEFWRRWHITLMRFMRAYLYIPLGGNRRGLALQAINISIVFFLTGLWHGAGWTFILWGIIHGILVLIAHLCRQIERRWLRPLRTWSAAVGNRYIHRLMLLAGWAVTLLCVVFLWVLFRSDSLAAARFLIKAMLKIGSLDFTLVQGTSAIFAFEYAEIAAFLAIGWALALFAPNSMQITSFAVSGRLSQSANGALARRGSIRLNLPARTVVSAMAIGVMLYLSLTTLNHVRSEFLYFQF
jgi:alginate O-acetyltransferase complex protein AlgI